MNELSQSNTTFKPRLTLALLLLGLVVVGFDQFCKWYVYTHVSSIESALYWYPYGGIPVFENWHGIEFSINYMTNKGAAWGAFGNYQLALVILRIALILGLMIYLSVAKLPRAIQIPLTLIIAGAVGNVTDYFVYGQVIDMFHFVIGGYDFPIFNLADSAITLGIGALFCSSWVTQTE